jgi:hypothetical protein
VRHRKLALALTAALALSACATSEDTTADLAAPASETETVTETETETATPTETATETETALALTQTCESDRWTVSLPEGWFGNEATDEIPACSFGHPSEPDELQGESLHYAARIYIDAVAYEDATAERDGELSSETATVAGQDATVYERESDGTGLVPEGERSYVYVLDLGDGESLIAATHSVGDTDYERDKELLDRMMDELELEG